MRDKVRLRVRVPFGVQTHELRVPLCLRVEQALPLALRLLESAGVPAWDLRSHPLLMLGEGDYAGLLVDGRERVEDLVCKGIVFDGSVVVLV